MATKHMDHLIKQAAHHLSDLLRDAICLQPSAKAWVIYDEQAGLTNILTQAYRQALPASARFTLIGEINPSSFLAELDAYKPGDFVALVQSNNFRLNEFRIRIELFKRGLKTMEFTHLDRMPETEWETYIESLAYDKDQLRTRGKALKEIIDVSHHIEVQCPGTSLVYETEMEPTKLNVGDYSGMTNVGGTFPIGEVFSEPKNFTGVNGTVKIFGYAGEDHVVRIVEPFLATVTQGILEAPDAPQDFKNILEKIKIDEPVIVREFGLGLNEALNKQRIVHDITAYERQKGLHLSLGGKHATYIKPGMSRKSGRYHVDVFVDVTSIVSDTGDIYRNGDFCV